ncbi:hypothetical protein [Streptosporangium pseudovulgare]|uniref:DUF2157 domain-containing protein n=1 Tax=Streptosporangium pseudovulgare TaxID=35765 RepID=A0ABQ2RHK3_9ACTN|nr:hypothetical protein [Streptosporangium pseudovulgare]GGQ26273.1 hypothetical protein GCM10010140_65560 [Streptosporangium pseudovulgare]
MTPIERRYRLLMRLAYPRGYRSDHGEEVLGVLLDCAEPGRTVPEARQVAGLVSGGLRERVRQAARGEAWRDGLHLGVTAVMAGQLAALLPYAGRIGVWVLVSAAGLLAVSRGRVWPALLCAALSGGKALLLAAAWQPVDVTLLPVYPGFLTDRPLFAASGPAAVGLGYAVVCCGLLVLTAGPPPGPRSSWWWAAVPVAAWAGPGLLAIEATLPVGLGRLVLEVGLLCLGVWAARTARDARWALAAALHLLVVSGQLTERLTELTRQHLTYWGLLAALTATAALVPGDRRRAVPN